jgi:hypothetical protein
VPCCCVYNLSAHARYSRGGSYDVNMSWASHKLFLILFFPLQLELFTFQICNFLKVDIFKNEIKIEWVLLKFYLPQNESSCLFNIPYICWYTHHHYIHTLMLVVIQDIKSFYIYSFSKYFFLICESLKVCIWYFENNVNDVGIPFFWHATLYFLNL